MTKKFLIDINVYILNFKTKCVDVFPEHENFSSIKKF